MSEEKYLPTIKAFNAALCEFRRARIPILKELRITAVGMRILSALNPHEEVSRAELADLLGLNTNTLGRPIDSLIKLKLIERREDPENRRFIKLSLTKAGKNLAKSYRTKMCKVWDIAFKDLSESQQLQFTHMLNSMVKQFKKQHRI